MTPGLVARARGLTRAYGGRTVLEGIDLDLHAGEIVGVVGPNGGGKSTLLLLLAGLVRPTAGEVTVAGVAAHLVAEELTGRIGLITAQPGLYPLLTGRENLRFFGRLFGLDAEQVATKALPLLQELRLEGEMDRRVAEYSSGMMQKLSLVRAMLLRPQLLLLDEPTANLDPVSAYRLYRAVQARADEGIAVVLATHDLPAAEGMCDRVCVIDRTLVAERRREGPRRPLAAGPLLELIQQAEAAR